MINSISKFEKKWACKSEGNSSCLPGNIHWHLLRRIYIRHSHSGKLCFQIRKYQIRSVRVSLWILPGSKFPLQGSWPNAVMTCISRLSNDIWIHCRSKRRVMVKQVSNNSLNVDAFFYQLPGYKENQRSVVETFQLFCLQIICLDTMPWLGVYLANDQ